jgi:hypothetical protein
MKTGKFIPLGNHSDIKIGYGTVDFKNLKTVYLKLNSWLQPTNLDENFDSIIVKTRREIKNLLYELNDTKFKKQSIVDLDIRTKGIKKEKRSFMNLEITLFVNNQFDIRSKDTKKNINNIIIKIIDDCLDNKNLFNFYKTKK